MEYKISNVFKRVEKKYQLAEEKKQEFLTAIEPHAIKDQFGEYTICNIYYDTEQDDLIRTSMEKPVYKEKLRLRSYGVPGAEDRVFLEIKKKYQGTVFKRRIALPFHEAAQYLETRKKPSEDSQILREIDYFLELYHPVPKLYLAYDRIAFTAKREEGLRITLDYRIRSRTEAVDFTAGDYGELLLPENEYILEIKSSTAFPLWLTEVLSKLEIYPVSFSKYGKIYSKNQIHEKGEDLSC